MATTKKSTKAKTKTASAKTARRTTSKKVSSAKTATKTADIKVARPSKQPRVLNVQRLLSLYAISAGLFLLLAVAAAVLMNDTSYQLTLGHLTKDQFVEGTLAPAVQSVYDIEVRWLVVTTLVLSVVGPVLYLTKLKNRYTDYMTKTRMLPFRWFDYAVTTALMVATVALLSGVSDLPTLKLLEGLMIVTCLLALVSERQNDRANKPVWSSFYVGLISGSLPWLFLAAYAVATVVYGGIRAPWYVYALYVALLGGFTLLTRNQWRQYRKIGAQASYLAAERNYLLINTVIKAAFAISLIVGLAK